MMESDDNNKRPALHHLKDPVAFIGLGFGSGLLPKAPGTYGTLAAMPIYYFLQGYGTSIYLAVTLFTCLFGIWVCAYTARLLGVHDHPAIVMDEIVGYLVTMTFVPFGIEWMIIGFVLFRVFDIIKPWPISWLDRHLQGGTGIMVDDIVAGIAAAGCLHLLTTIL